MDFATQIYLAKLHYEQRRERSRVVLEGHTIFLERSLEFKQGSRVKTVASLVIILLAVVALFATTKAQEVPQTVFVASETLTRQALGGHHV